MSNPFPARFDSTCDSCGTEIPEGEMLYAVHGDYYCRDCAEAGGNVCECGAFKNEGYDTCYNCVDKEYDDTF